MTLEFSRQIIEKYSGIKFHEILRVGAKLFLADGETLGMMKLIVVFRIFGNTLKNKRRGKKYIVTHFVRLELF